MGYTLEVYALKVEPFEATLQEGSAAARPVDVPSSIWEEAINGFRRGEASGTVVSVLVELIRLRGRRLVFLEHASRSGVQFRSTIDRIAPFLIRRPFVGIEPDDLPWFGWLAWTEIDLARSDSINDAGPDELGWRGDILRALEYAMRVESDVVTIYT